MFGGDDVLLGVGLLETKEGLIRSIIRQPMGHKTEMKMNMSTWIMLLLVFVLAIFAYIKDPALVPEGL